MEDREDRLRAKASDGYRLWRPFNDDTLPYAFRVSDIGELPHYVNRIFGLSKGNVADKPDALVMLCAAAHGFITIEEVMGICHISYNKISTVFAGYSKQSAAKGFPAYFERCTFETPVEQSKVFYRLTRLGFERAAEISEGVFDAKYRTSRQRSFIHPYGMGKNLFSIMPLMAEVNGFVRLFYEVSDKQKGIFPTDYGLLRDSRGGLFTDAVAYLYDSSRKFMARVYIEQDTGAEPVKTLADKLQKYKEKGFTDIDRYGDVIAFSVLVRNNYTKSPLLPKRLGAAGSYRLDKYDLSNLRIAADEMERSDWTIREYLAACKDKALIKALENLRHTVEPLRLSRPFDDMGPDFVRQYIKNRDALRDPYLIRQFNLINLFSSRSIISGLARHYAFGSESDSFHNPDSIVSSMLQGFPVICAPTSLMGSALSFFLRDPFKKLWANRIGTILRKYFGNVGYLSDRVFIQQDNGSYYLRNVYGIGKSSKNRVCVEFPCYDIAAWIRVLWFVKSQPRDKDASKYEQKMPFNVVCVLDSLKQVSEFFDFVRSTYPFKEVREGYGGIFAIVRPSLTQDSPMLLRGYFDEGRGEFDSLPIEGGL